MGAEFHTLKIAGTQSRAEVREAFKKAQDEDRYENGHSYSGGVGMADGLEFSDSDTFNSKEAAVKYLDEHCVKWEAALAVRFRDEADSFHWLIGAVCAS